MAARISVLIATKDRAELLPHILQRLERMERRPDLVCFSACSETDVVSLKENSSIPVVTIFGAAGSPMQRNRGVRALRSESDIIVFFDDDFVPSRTWISELEKLFHETPDALGIGGILVADGARTGAIPIEEAQKLVDQFDVGHFRTKTPAAETDELYGCNMAFRSELFDVIIFDENLQSYAWLEDKDFCRRASRMGKLISAHNLTGVHLGYSGGRISEVDLGAAQVRNPTYLCKKGTLSTMETFAIISRVVASNLFKSIRSEARRKRLSGNLRAIAWFLSTNKQH
jgi:GT2 family glycosyltransferase